MEQQTDRTDTLIDRKTDRWIEGTSQNDRHTVNQTDKRTRQRQSNRQSDGKTDRR